MKEQFEALAKHFESDQIGCEVRYAEIVDSTNKRILDLPADESAHGLVVVARRQTAGRGRQQRAWLSPPDLGLYFTILIRPRRQNYPAALLSLAAAVAIHDALAPFCSGQLEIKWPNDVLLNGRKVSGVLGEVRMAGSVIERIALGMSVNLTYKNEDFPEELRGRATSVLIEEGAAPEPPALLRRILEHLNSWCDAIETADDAAILDAVGTRSKMMRGTTVRFSSEHGPLMTGATGGLDNDGALRVRLDSGVEVSLQAGDVHLVGNKS